MRRLQDWTLIIVGLAALAASASLGAQDEKPVPKDSVRVYIPGCSKGQIFTAGPRTEDQPNRSNIAEGTHFRMQGPKKVINEIKAREGQVIEITGLVRKGPTGPQGVKVAPGVRITPGPSGVGASIGHDPLYEQSVIDVESWKLSPGKCANK